MAANHTGIAAMTTYELVRNVHILAGTIALATFWTAAMLRKGSPAHINVGRTFMIAMTAIALTGVPLALSAFARGAPILGTVLLYIVVITVTPTWLAWRAVRDKRDFTSFVGPTYRALIWVNVATGLVVLGFGIWIQNILLMLISPIGILTGFFMLRFARQEPTDKRWWLVRHYGAIIGAGIATHVAFLNIGFARMLPPELGSTAQKLSWLVPFIVALIARVYLDRKYGPKRAGAPAQSTAAG
jgi:hypothetical protein